VNLTGFELSNAISGTSGSQDTMILVGMQVSKTPNYPVMLPFPVVVAL